MRRFLFCFIVCSSILKAQTEETFMDGDFLTNPVWVGNTAKWTVVDGQLRSNSSIAKDTFYLSTASTLAAQAQWEFMVNLKFATSSSNFTDIYLMCDSANLKSANRAGYFVKVGNTKDEICLYKRIGGKNIKIIDGADGITNTSNNIIKIKVTRNSNNIWKLKRDLTGSGLNYVTEGTITDSEIINSSYFGFSIKQSTSSFFQKHFYDNINIKSIVIDTNAPTVVSTTVISPTQLDVLYSEYVDVTTSEMTANYLLNDSLGNPKTVLRDSTNPSLVHLTFASPFIDSLINTLNISGVEDFNDNTIAQSNTPFVYFAPSVPIFKDVIINEIFPDPSPPIGLPDAEFLEIFNNSSKTFNLNGWQLGDATGSNVITTSNIYFAPNEYLIICRDLDTLLYKPFGRVIGMASFPSLNNTGDKIYIKGSNLAITDSISYSDNWYQSTLKKAGGFTLELIKPRGNINCPTFTNWTASNNPNGGTPGVINSVFSNSDVPNELLKVSSISNDSILLLFNGTIDTSTMLNVDNYSVDKEIGRIAHANIYNGDFTQILLTFSTALEQGVFHVITINSIKGCPENKINANVSKSFIIPQQPETNDLVINELLSNPKENGVDFIEIYNRSDKTLDLKNIYVSQYDTINNVSFKKELITTESKLIYPKEYLVLSINGEAIKNQYFTTNPTGFIDVNKMPTMNIASGAICLSTPTTVIDYIKYDETMHFDLLNDTKGVSLERIDYNRSAQDKTNWHSASQTTGFATPSYENSQYNSSTKTEDQFTLLPELFSPDQDGINDIITIGYSFDMPGLMGNIKIYDSKGRLIKNLVKNELLSTNGSYSWDGIDDNSEKARIGIYVILFEAIDLTGKVQHFKKTCVVAGK